MSLRARGSGAVIIRWLNRPLCREGKPDLQKEGFQSLDLIHGPSYQEFSQKYEAKTSTTGGGNVSLSTLSPFQIFVPYFQQQPTTLLFISTRRPPFSTIETLTAYVNLDLTRDEGIKPSLLPQSIARCGSSKHSSTPHQSRGTPTLIFLTQLPFPSHS